MTTTAGVDAGNDGSGITLALGANIPPASGETILSALNADIDAVRAIEDLTARTAAAASLAAALWERLEAARERRMGAALALHVTHNLKPRDVYRPLGIAPTTLSSMRDRAKKAAARTGAAIPDLTLDEAWAEVTAANEQVRELEDPTGEALALRRDLILEGLGAVRRSGRTLEEGYEQLAETTGLGPDRIKAIRKAAVKAGLDETTEAPWKVVRARILHRIKRRAPAAYAPGNLLPATGGLAKEFKVDRTAVLLALRSLRDDGFVDPPTKAGWRVSTPAEPAKRWRSLTD